MVRGNEMIRRNAMNRKKYRATRRRNIFVLSVLSVIICIIASMLFFTNSFANDNSEEELYKYYAVITVEYKDTLTSIASNNCSIGYDSTSDYINEVCFINHISDPDSIYEGQSLIIPYYSDEMK